MRRSPELAPLSRDHQHALDAALRLRRADAGSVDAAVSHFQSFFASEGIRHFAMEEELLLPALPADDPEWAPAVGRVLEDHEAIRSAAATLAPAGEGEDPVASARALGERLNAHVRFEERVLFEILERRLPAVALARLGRAIDAAERSGGAQAPPG